MLKAIGIFPKISFSIPIMKQLLWSSIEMWHYCLVHISRGRIELPIEEWNALSGTLICIVYISFFFVMFYGYKWSKLRNYVIKDINIKTFMHMWNHLFKYLTLLSIFSFYTFFKGSIVTNIV